MALNFLNNGYFAGKVGIGTESPTAKLELGTNDFIMVNPGTGGRAGILFNETGTPSATNVQYGARISYAESGDVLELVMRENNVDKLGIAIARQTGNVGIGVAGPTKTLHVVSAAEAALFQGTATWGTGIQIDATATGGRNFQIQSSADTAGEGGGKFLIVDRDATGGPTRLSINSGGNVGIGTTSPLVKLQVYGNPMPAAADAASVEDMLTLYRNGSSSVWAGGASLSLGRYSAGGSSPKSRLDFKLKAAAGSNTALPELTVMTMNSDGRVGIGTDDPSHLLQLSGSGNVALAITSGTTNTAIINFGDSSNDDAGIIAYTNDAGGSDHMAFTVATSERMRISANGNVGIGTTSPLHDLQIGTAATNGSYSMMIEGNFANTALSSNPRLNLIDTNFGITAGKYGSGASDDAIGIFAYQGAGRGILFAHTTAGSGTTLQNMRQDMFVDGGTGNVGIGTTSPTEKLHIKSTVSGSFIRFEDNGGSGVYVGSRSNELEIYAGGSERMKIDAAGAIQFNAYNDANNTGTPTYLLGTDASGNVVKTNTVPGSGAGPYLPLSAGSSYPLTGDLYMPGFIFHVGDTDSYFGFGAPNVFDLVTGGSRKLYADNTAVYLYKSGSQKLRTTSTGVTVTGDIKIDSALLSNQNNTDVDTGTETVANVAIATYTAAFFDFVIKKTTNVRSGTVYACHDGTNVEFTETSTQDLGDTSDVTLSVDISGGNMRLLATVTSDDWSVKSLIRAI